MTDWSPIVEQHGPLVWQTVYRLLNHEADAHDCFQRVFLAALQLDQKERVRHWPALLKKLATARALDLLRCRYRHQACLQPLHEEGYVDSRLHHPSEHAIAGELADELRQALSELEPISAEIFYLASFEGWSYEAIAEQWGMTSNHVGVLINRTRMALRKKLHAHLPNTTAGEPT
ncbi:MAG TPA: sigma-70 family RNA polymerase sigma factor [Gemmatales bacterium]|nr:sigma-70 family RNA polymerase sigma factor [Gemmatales bacterium]